jgi:HTH-type transcriptional regulator/antitoxin HigA
VDEQASDWAAPPARLTVFARATRPYFYQARIARFADKLGAPPALVVGQLQKRGEIPWTHSRTLLAKVRHMLAVEG